MVGGRWRGEGALASWGGHSAARKEAGFREGGNLRLEKWLAVQVAAPLPSHWLELGFAVGPATWGNCMGQE